MKNRKVKILFHVLEVLIFLSLPIVFAPRDVELSHVFDSMIVRIDMACYLFLVIYFYCNYYLGVPILYLKKKYIFFVLFTLTFFVCLNIIPELFFTFSDGMPPPPPHGSPHEMGIPPGFRHFFMLFLLVFFVSLMLRINARWKQSEKERMSAELAHLKAQINPHFLFNTLNSIYSLALEKSDETPNAVVRLSGMMRYVISEADNDFVSLDKEIKYICDYIDLQKIRLGSTTKLDFIVEGDTSGKQIAPLILIPFVENAFKFGVNPEEDATISIRIVLKDGRLDMRVKNDKVNKMQPEEQKSGLGIQNTKDRLQHIYASRHLLDIRETETEYTVILNMVL